MNDSILWLGLLGLGAAHGINPAMGWLFAVGSGLQRRERAAVWRAMGPLALGHACAIGVVVLLAAASGLVVPVSWLRWTTAALLIGCGVLHLMRHGHVRYGGMRMSGRELTIWSFLMASAHGAGLMALPFVIGSTGGSAAPAPHVHSVAAGGQGHATHVLTAGLDGAQALGLGATLVHTLGYLAVTGLVAALVYEKLGVRVLRRAWLNLDLFWAIALIGMGLLTPLF
jgi:hypothetical protein